MTRTTWPGGRVPKFFLLVFLASALAGVLFAPPWALRVQAATPAASAQVTTRLSAWLWRQGKSEAYTSQRLLPGELVRWQLEARNSGDKPASNLQFDLDLAPPTRFQAGSVTGTAAFAFSLDGTAFAPQPQVATPQGWQPAPVEDYRKLRLYLPALAPQATWSATYTVAVR